MDINGVIKDQQLAMIRMSTGQRINSAADDAAGLSIAEGLGAQGNGENVAQRNMRDSQSMYATAEGGLDASHSVLQRMRELAIQANNGILTDSDRSVIHNEFSQLRDSLNAIGRYTQFNSKNLLDGSLQNNQTITNANGEGMSISIDSALASALGDEQSTTSLSDVNLLTNPTSALKVVDGAISQVSTMRSNIGAINNRLDYASNVSETKEHNMRSSQSRIRDADMVKQAIDINRANLLQQTYFATQKINQTVTGQIMNFWI